MPVRMVEGRLDDFVAALKKSGGSSGNRALRQRLGWEEEFYWRVQGRLIEKGIIAPGRGMGGSVHLTDRLEEPVSVGHELPDAQNESIKESDLYRPLKQSIQKNWINRFGFDEVRVDETHSLGKRDTGGKFTRPDITAVGVRRYKYATKRLEVVTFEVKAGDSVGIMGVLEAIAHRESAHRAYVIYATSKEKLESSHENDRIFEISQKYGIGVILAENPVAVEDWEIVLDALRHEPDPDRLDRFLDEVPTEDTKEWLTKLRS